MSRNLHLCLPALTTAVTSIPILSANTGETTFFVHQSSDSGKLFASTIILDETERNSRGSLCRDASSYNKLRSPFISIYNEESLQYVDP